MPLRSIQPAIAALHQEVRDVQIVDVDEGDAAAERGVNGMRVNALQVMCAGIIGRMGFSGENGPLRSSERRQNVRQSLGVSKNQFREFTIGKPAGESNGECRRVQERARRGNPSSGHMLCHPELAGPQHAIAAVEPPQKLTIRRRVGLGGGFRPTGRGLG
jgi:hypothetical protein